MIRERFLQGRLSDRMALSTLQQQHRKGTIMKWKVAMLSLLLAISNKQRAREKTKAA